MNKNDPDETPDLWKSSDDEVVSPPELPPELKKVKVNDDLKIFNIDPGSLTVQPVEPPPRETVPDDTLADDLPASVKLLPEEELDKIIRESKEIVEKGQQQCTQLKLENQRLAYMMFRVFETLEVFENHLGMMSKFNLVFYTQRGVSLAEVVGMRNRCGEPYELLEDYGTLAVHLLKNVQEKLELNTGMGPVKEADVKELTYNVWENCYELGNLLSAALLLCDRLEKTRQESDNLYKESSAHVANWYLMFNVIAQKQDHLRELWFKVASDIAFLETGEHDISIKIDVDKAIHGVDEKS